MSVTLRPMRADEYPAWAEEGERGYVDQMVEFGGMDIHACGPWCQKGSPQDGFASWNPGSPRLRSSTWMC